MISYTPPSETSSSSPPPVPPSEVGRTPDASRALAPSHHRSPPGAFGSIGSRLPPARSCESDPMETATQTLHRLTSYAPELEWDIPIDDPRVVADFVSTDIDRFPWFYKRLRTGAAPDRPPPRPARHHRAGGRGAGGNGGRDAGRPGPGAAVPAA